MDNNFDPDAYLASNDPPAQPSPAFNPDAYLATRAPDEGSMMAAGRGALRNFPGAQQLVAGVKEGPYDKNLADLTAKAEASKAAHPVAYGAGAVGGSAIPMAIPGVGEAMAASYPAAMLGGAGLGAVQALSDTPLNKNPGTVAKTAAKGGAAGALGGAVGQWLGNLFPTISEAESAATVQKLNVPGRRLANVLGTDVDEGLKDIATSLRETKLPNGEGLNSMSDYPLRLAGKVKDAVDMYGKQIGDVVDKVDVDVPMAPISDTIKGMATSESGLATRNAYLDQIQGLIKENVDKEGNFSFGKLRDLTNHIYREMVVEDPQTGRLAPGSEKALEAWKFLRGYQDDIIKSEHPDLFPHFASANKNFSNLVGLQKALNATALRQEATQTKPASFFNPLSWGSKMGNVASGATGAGRVANNAPFKIMPGVSATRKALPSGIPSAEAADLADYLENKFGKEKIKQ